MLMTLSGVGPKTASWIVRNYLGSPVVAIIDIHVRRAGQAAGFFDPGWKLPADYFLLERAFLGFAKAAQVAPPELDACIWEQMRQLGKFQSEVLASVTTGRLLRQHVAATYSHCNQVLDWPIRSSDFKEATSPHNA
jgi:hypothetical protein